MCVLVAHTPKKQNRYVLFALRGTCKKRKVFSCEPMCYTPPVLVDSTLETSGPSLCVKSEVLLGPQYASPLSISV